MAEAAQASSWVTADLTGGMMGIGAAMASGTMQGFAAGIDPGYGVQMAQDSIRRVPFAKIEWPTVNASNVEPTPHMQDCPRCGKRPCLMAILTEQEPHAITFFRVECIQCNTCCASYGKHNDAIEAWNRIKWKAPEPAKPTRQSKKFKMTADVPSIKLE